MNQKPCLHEGFSFPVDLYYFNLSNCQKSLWCAEISMKSVHTCTRTSHAYFSCHPSEPGKSCFQSWFSSLSSLKSLLFLQCLHLHLRIFVQQHFLNNKDRCLKKKRLLTLNTCQWIYQQTKCLKFLKRKQTRSHNKWTLPHSDLSCCQCFCAFHYICYYIDLRVFVVIYYHINFLLV